MEDGWVEALAEAGLSRNEALAWLTLLDGGPSGLTGYEVGARSGIPRSAVYGVLRRLEAAQAAFAVSAHPARYAATAPRRFLLERARSAAARLGRLADDLDARPRPAAPEPIFTLNRYDEVMERAEAMIAGARQSLVLSAWSREVERLAPALAAVASRPLHRVLHCVDALARPPAGFSVWTDDVAGDPAKAAWSHKMLLVADRREALLGGTEPGAANHAVWTSNPTVVDVTTDHVILDITLLSRATGRPCTADVSPLMRPHLSTA